MGLNNLTIVGRLTGDPERKSYGDGKTLLNFSIAHNVRVSDGQGGWKDDPTFLDCVMFDRRADAFLKFFANGRGKRVIITGSIRQERWETSEGGKRSKIVCRANDWDFGEAPNSDQGSQAGAPSLPPGGKVPSDVPF